MLMQYTSIQILKNLNIEKNKTIFLTFAENLCTKSLLPHICAIFGNAIELIGLHLSKTFFYITGH